jgi:peptidoglycan/xylan/chitin deacetylase (PgdA/CDA1 family)
MKDMQLIRTYKEFTYTEPATAKLRNSVRSLAIRALSLKNNIAGNGNWIRLPYYHHVFEDEQKDFERQLRYLKNFGEYISLDDVCALLTENKPLNGRYFCISFDDGYRCLHEYMMPITASLDIPVMIYLPTDYINTNEKNEADLQLIRDNLPGNPGLLSFLSWEQCRDMLEHKISFGSHTKTHAHLAKMNKDEIEFELRFSKEVMEKNIPAPCIHFSCPWGKRGIDFNSALTKELAMQLGYISITTTDRGKTVAGDDPYLLKRDHILAEWGNYQLRYFLGR